MAEPAVPSLGRPPASAARMRARRRRHECGRARGQRAPCSPPAPAWSPSGAIATSSTRPRRRELPGRPHRDVRPDRRGRGVAISPSACTRRSAASTASSTSSAAGAAAAGSPGRPTRTTASSRRRSRRCGTRAGRSTTTCAHRRRAPRDRVVHRGRASARRRRELRGGQGRERGVDARGRAGLRQERAGCRHPPFRAASVVFRVKSPGGTRGDARGSGRRPLGAGCGIAQRHRLALE